MAESDGERIGNSHYLSSVKTSGGLCAVMHRGALYLFVRDVNGKRVYCHKSISGSPMDLDGGTGLPITTNDDIAAASLNGVLCVITKDGTNSNRGGVMRATMGGDGTWSRGYQIGRDVVASGSPGLMATNERLEVFFREPDGGGILHFSSPDGINWKAEPFTGHATTDGAAAVHYRGNTMLFYPFVKNQGDGNMYPQRALAHGYVPPAVQLDLSDHYPYMVDVVY